MERVPDIVWCERLLEGRFEFFDGDLLLAHVSRRRAPGRGHLDPFAQRVSFWEGTSTTRRWRSWVRWSSWSCCGSRNDDTATCSCTTPEQSNSKFAPDFSQIWSYAGWVVISAPPPEPSAEAIQELTARLPALLPLAQREDRYLPWDEFRRRLPCDDVRREPAHRAK